MDIHEVLLGVRGKTSFNTCSLWLKTVAKETPIHIQKNEKTVLSSLTT